MDYKTARRLLIEWYETALAAVDPEAAVASHLEIPEVRGDLVVLALGKAAPAMARGVVRVVGHDELAGLAVSNHADTVPKGTDLLVGSHPVPDERSLRAGEALLERARQLTADDVAIVLISGGGSALAEVPVSGVTIAEVAVVNELLLRSGADIVETNIVRRRLSQLKGGGLAEAIAPARAVTLVMSDVVGDPVDVIASGPTVAIQDAPEEALHIVQRLGLHNELPASVVAALAGPPARRRSSAIQSINVIASGSVAAHAAAAAAEKVGYPAIVLDTRLQGDAGAAAGEVLERSSGSLSVFAGETTVDVTGDGIGGRNHEAALVAATLLEGRSDVFFLAAGTDGIDGTAMAAGAIVDGTTMARARALGLDPERALHRNDSGTFFADLGDNLVTGITGTNVGDLWMVLRTD